MARHRLFGWIASSCLLCLSLNLFAISLLHAQGLQVPSPHSPVSSEAGVVNEAAIVLQELTTGTAERIPERLLAEAHAIAIVPRAMRGAFVIGISGGRGVLVSRDAAGRWQAPEFITLGGGSLGWQIGVQSNDLVIVFRTPRSLEGIRQGRLTLGANASVAAGPMGRYASAATDTSMQAEILTYSRSRGLFAGVSLQGSVLQLDNAATQRFYQMTAEGPGVIPPSAQALVNEINRFTSNQAQPTASPANISGTPSSQTAPGPSSVDPRARRLADAVVLLQARVDEQWKQYLGLPPDWATGRPLTSTDVQSVLVRYERVETNPELAALRALPEFQQALGELRALAVQVAPAGNQLVLPPPPTATTNGVSRVPN